MENKTEVGDYVRTKDGKLAKIVRTEFDDEEQKDIYIFSEEIITYYEYTTDNCYKEELHKYILKSSENIIGLIEVGDYVNGHKILEIKQNLENGLRYLMYDYVPIKYYIERSDKIKSIVTKEQFKAIEYKIQEQN